MKNLHQQVLELLPQCIEDRRWLHRHAELSFRNTRQRIIWSRRCANWKGWNSAVLHPPV